MITKAHYGVGEVDQVVGGGGSRFWQQSLRPTMGGSPVWRPGPSQCRDVLSVWGSPCWRWDGLATVFSLLWGSSYLGGRSLHCDGARLVFTCTSYLLGDDQRWRESALINDVLYACVYILQLTFVFVNNIQVKSGVELMFGIRVPVSPGWIDEISIWFTDIIH